MFVSLDLETTGFFPETDKIIEFGAVKFDLNGEIKETLQFFVNPGIIIPQIITHITNIKDGDLKTAPPIEEKLEEIDNFIKDCTLIGHNIKFDTDFLSNAGLEITNPEYDTYELAGILLPNLPSYSLEILSKILKLKHEEKHRALDDAIASKELFLTLLEKFQSFPQEFLLEIQNLCKKSAWPLKNLISSLKPAIQQQSQQQQQEKAVINPPSQNNKTNFKEILKHKTSTLFQVNSPYLELVKDLASNAKKDTYIALPYNLFRQIHDEIPDNIAKIDLPKNYISIQRLKEFANKNYYENHELTALLKYLIWLTQTKTGLLNEVHITKDEKSTIEKINIDESIAAPGKNEKFFKKALEKDKNNPAICSHAHIIENPVKNAELIIIDLEEFIKSFHKYHSLYLRLDLLLNSLQALQEIFPENQTIQSLIAKSVILFGIIGIIFEKTNDKSKFSPKSTIREITLNTKEWLDAKEIVKNLISISKELGEINNKNTFGYLQTWKKYLHSLNDIFINPNITENMVWIEKDMNEEIILRKIPFSNKQNLEKFFQIFKNYKIIDENIDLLDEGKLVKELSGLNESLPIRIYNKKAENLEIYIVKNINDEDKNQLPNFFIDYLKNTNEKTAVIFNSKVNLEYFTLKLSAAKIPIISQITSPLKKLQEQLKQLESSPAHVLLTPNNWINLENYEDIKTLFIHKIPFDPPSDPVLIALSQNHDDPFNELQIPRAILALKKLINRLRNINLNKKIIILDSRIIYKEYGSQFIENLNTISSPQIIALESLKNYIK